MRRGEVRWAMLSPRALLVGVGAASGPLAARELEVLHDLDKVELLFERLPGLVGSQLSLNALREDLEVSFATVASWMTISSAALLRAVARARRGDAAGASTIAREYLARYPSGLRVHEAKQLITPSAEQD